MTNLELYNIIDEAQRILVENWGDQGKEVIALAFKVRKFDGDMKAWLKFCTACGGNWGGMLLTGVRDLYPEVWEFCFCFYLQSSDSAWSQNMGVRIGWRVAALHAPLRMSIYMLHKI